MMGRPMNVYQKSMIRELYPPGTRIELIRMEDPWTMLKPGDRGTVTMIDDAAQIHMAWDSGSGLALIPGEDEFKVVKE